MTTVTIDDELATRLRDKGDDFNALVADALAEPARRWEREAAGRAEMQAMLDGPRHTLAESNERMRRKYGYPDLSHLTRDELANREEATPAGLPPEKVAEARRLGLA